MHGSPRVSCGPIHCARMQTALEGGVAQLGGCPHCVIVADWFPFPTNRIFRAVKPTIAYFCGLPFASRTTFVGSETGVTATWPTGMRVQSTLEKPGSMHTYVGGGLCNGKM